jgi:hypothetical protein
VAVIVGVGRGGGERENGAGRQRDTTHTDNRGGGVRIMHILQSIEIKFWVRFAEWPMWATRQRICFMSVLFQHSAKFLFAE